MTTTAIAQIREFNRFYTRILGLLDKGILNSSFSLPEARVLYELHHLQPCSAKEVIQALDIDKGYLSRILKSFVRKGLIQIQPTPADTRASEIKLTTKGKVEFEKLNTASAKQIRNLLASLPDNKIKTVISHMQAIQKLLNNEL
jgi:DNA-binding MarR family transcriptional regulator